MFYYLFDNVSFYMFIYLDFVFGLFNKRIMLQYDYRQNSYQCLLNGHVLFYMDM